MKIIFGSPKATSTSIVEQYPDRAVVTIEAIKEAGKSRRVIFNKQASLDLDLEKGNPQTLMFGWVTDIDENGVEAKFVVVSDVSGLATPPSSIVYKTSKNLVKYGEDDTQRGKAISNGKLIANFNSHIGESDSERKFELVEFPSPEAEAHGLNLYKFVDLVEAVEVPIDDAHDVEQAEEVTGNVGVTSDFI